MAEYIDIDKAVLVADIRGREVKTTVRHILGLNKGIYDTDDVQPVRHGRWIPVDEMEDAFDCSECDAMVSKRLNYCPKCGAKMDGET